MKETPHRIALAVLLVLHGVGLVGLNTKAFHQEFLALIWVNLLFLFAIVLSLHRHWNVRYLALVPAVFLLGMAAEIIGVRTDQIFGAYSYTDRLGAPFAGVPPVIGLNWVVLTYCAGMVALRVDRSPWIRVPLGAALMVGMDVLIEPFAAKYGLWTWLGEHPPLRNWAGWIAMSLLLQGVFVYAIRRSWNPIAIWAFFILAAFFLLDLLWTAVG